MDRDKKTFAFREYLIVGILLVLSIICFIGSTQLMIKKNFQVNSAATFPFVISGFMIFCMAMALVQAIKKMPKDVEKYNSFGELLVESFKEAFPKELLVSIAMIIVYLLILDKIGFVASSMIFILAAMFYLSKGKQKKWVLAASGVGSVILIYIVFRIVFKVLLP